MTKYFGGKNATVRHLINQIPPHDTLIETHLGSGALMYHIRPSRLQIGIDINPDVITAHKTTTDAQILTTLLALANDHAPPPSAAKHTTSSIVSIDDDIEAIATIDDARCTHGRPSPETTIPPGERLFICNDALSFLETDTTWIHSDRTFLYVDPPYLHSTRTSSKTYKYEYTYDDHCRLLNELNTLDCMIMVSGYESWLYNNHLSHWRRYEYYATTQGGTRRKEILWMNYPEPEQLHDYRYLGNTFRERERIKRKRNRWKTRWSHMPLYERQAIFWAIQETQNNVTI